MSLVEISQDKPAEHGLEPFLEEFLTDRFTDLEKMKGYISDQDLDGLEQLTHRWAGICAPYGFQALGKKARELNNLIKNQQLPNDNTINDIREYLLNKKIALGF